MKAKEFFKKYILRFPVIELIVFALILFIDLLSKNLVAQAAVRSGNTFYYTVNIIGEFLQIRYAENTGAAWSFMAGVPWAQTFLLVMAGVAIPGFITYLFFNRKKGPLVRIALTMIIVGATGNFLDRLFLGYVRDFISFSFFNPIFNIADSSLTIGVCLFILYAVLDIIMDEKKKRAKAAASETAETEPPAGVPEDKP